MTKFKGARSHHLAWHAHSRATCTPADVHGRDELQPRGVLGASAHQQATAGGLPGRERAVRVLGLSRMLIRLTRSGPSTLAFMQGDGIFGRRNR